VSGSGVNLYAFCGGDPVNNRELYGLCDDSGGVSLGSVCSWFSDGWNRLKDMFGGSNSSATSDEQARPDVTTNVSSGSNSGRGYSDMGYNSGYGRGVYSDDDDVYYLPTFTVTVDQSDKTDDVVYLDPFNVEAPYDYIRQEFLRQTHDEMEADLSRQRGGVDVALAMADAARTAKDGYTALVESGVFVHKIGDKWVKFKVKKIHSRININSRIRTAYSNFSLQVTLLPDGTVEIQPCVDIYINPNMADDMDSATGKSAYDAAEEDENEHVADYQAYMNGRFNNEIVKYLDYFNTIFKDNNLSSDQIGDMVSNKFQTRVLQVANVSINYWDVQLAGYGDKYHHLIYDHTRFLGTSRQPNATEVDRYRSNAYGSSKI
jgi:hypothetical protein